MYIRIQSLINIRRRKKNGLQEKIMFFLESDIALIATTTTVDHLIVLQL